MMHVFTDIVMPVHDALDYLKASVESVEKHTTNFRFIFVDDFSQPETTEFLLANVQQNRNNLYIRTGKQKWFTRAANLGLRLARTQWTLLLNSDTVVDEGWLDEMYAVLEEAHKADSSPIGLVGSCLSAEEQRRWAPTAEPNYVTGHCLLLNIDAVSKMSVLRGMAGWYFNEMLRDHIHINSDRTLCYELNRNGYQTIASFKSAVGHHFAKSWGANLGLLSTVSIQDVD